MLSNHFFGRYSVSQNFGLQNKLIPPVRLNILTQVLRGLIAVCIYTGNSMHFCPIFWQGEYRADRFP